MRRALVSCATAALLAGCTMGPDYSRPGVDAPQAFRFAPAEVGETADTEWWREFGDPVLDALIAEALANNLSVKIAVANVEQAAGVFTQTRSPLFPQVGYSVSGARERTTEAGASPETAKLIPNPTTAYQALLTASWEIDLWGRIRRLSEAARANLLATDQARRGVILSLVASVASDYIQLRGLDEQLAVAKQTLGTYGESLRLFNLQFRYGQISQMNVAQAQSQYETAAAQIPQIELQIAQLETALSILVGRNPGPIDRGKPIAEFKQPALPAGLPSQLLERRPDLMQAEQELIAANAQIGAAKALYFPTISLTGAFGSASPDLNKLFTGPARVWSYAGQAIGPIFTFGAVSGQVAQAEGGQQSALYNYGLAIQNAFGDVDNALIANQKLREQSAAQDRLVAALRDYERLATLQYKGGYTSYTTVLQAQQSLFPAELTLASLRAQVVASSVNIYKAMGGGWVTLADQATASTPPVEGTVQRVPLF
ncbi:MAG TPA: efflux transporter outer membrane subunit [Casimicrobiaceae bacterium]|nr:efflux transporter outer membrane subunit [Casimicrobiaceae bacterium]